MLRTINCKDCGDTFKYEFNENELRGGRKRYCEKCKKIRKAIADKEQHRMKRPVITKKLKITKTQVIEDAIKFVLHLNSFSKITEPTSKIYDKVMNILPDNYVSRDALRRQYRDVMLKNEI